jgi:hypothetical protein
MKKDRIELQEELKQHAPSLLDLLDKGSGQTLPPNYFEQLEQSVFEKIKAEEPTLTHTFPKKGGAKILGFPRMAVLSIAATFTLILASLWFFRSSQDTQYLNNYQELASTLTAQDAESYILENIHEFETSSLESYVSIPEPTKEIIQSPKPSETPASQSPNPTDALLDDLSNEELDLLLNDLSDEELESIIL